MPINTGQAATQPRRHLRLVSSSPSNFESRYPVLHELASNRDAYKREGTGKSDGHWIQMLHVPRVLFTCMERIGPRVAPNSPKAQQPGQHLRWAVLLHFGMQGLRDNKDIQRLIELKDEINRLSQPDHELLDTLAPWFSNFDLGRFTITMAKPVPRVNFGVPPDMFWEHDKLHHETAIIKYNLAVLCAAIALSKIEQNDGDPVVIPAHQKMIDDALGEFYRNIRMRRRVAERLMRDLRGVGGGGLRGESYICAKCRSEIEV